MHSNEKERGRCSKAYQSAFYDWFLPSQYLVIKSESVLDRTTKRLRANRRRFSRKNPYYRRPPRLIQIYLCAYLDLESSRCEHTHWTGKPIALTNRPRVFSIDERADKVFSRRGKCKWCGSDKVIKNGRKDGQQLYKCKECKHQFFDNGKPPRMKKSKDTIALALELYYEGHSLRKTQRMLKKFAKTNVSNKVIWEWIQKYTPTVSDYLSNFRPQLSGNWFADETVLKFRGKTHWHWDAIDEGTRFLVGNHLSANRSFQHGKTFFENCGRNKPRPQTITTDNLLVYPRAINSEFFSRYSHRRVKHNQIDHVSENIMIERWHGTLKDRTKVMRGLKSPETEIINGFVIHYNFLREHGSLKGKTPAQMSQIELPFEDGWGDLITWSTHWQTLCQTEKPT